MFHFARFLPAVFSASMIRTSDKIKNRQAYLALYLNDRDPSLWLEPVSLIDGSQPWKRTELPPDFWHTGGIANWSAIAWMRS